MEKIVFIGDSLTQGIPGVSYFRYLHHKSKFSNQGRGGDTILGATERTKGILQKKRFAGCRKYIIEIGTNDVLLPTLSRHSSFWKLFVLLKGKVMGCIPCDNIKMFKEAYEELITLLIDEKKEIGIVGLPIIENGNLKVNETMGEYAKVVACLADKYKIPYVDVRSLEEQIKSDNKGTYFFGKTNIGSIIDAIFTTILPFSMICSRMRGLAVTIDSVHLNKRAAKELAVLIEEKLLR